MNGRQSLGNCHKNTITATTATLQYIHRCYKLYLFISRLVIRTFKCTYNQEDLLVLSNSSILRVICCVTPRIIHMLSNLYYIRLI